MNKKYYIKKLILLYIKYLLTFDKDEKYLYLDNIDNLIDFVKQSEFNDIYIPKFFDYLGDYNNKTCNRVTKYSCDAFKSILDVKTLYEDYFKLNDDINIILNDPDIYKEEYKEEIDLESTRELVNDFFMHYDTDVYLYYNYLKNNNLIRKPNSKTSSVDGLTMFVTKNKINPFFIEEYECLFDAILIVHETMHSYVLNKILNNISYEEFSRYLINNIDEVGPLFIEMVFLNYINKKGLYKEEIRIAKYESIENYLKYFLNIEDSLNRLIYGPYYEEKSDDEEVVTFDYSEKYGLGYLYAFIFYQRYLENGDKNKLYSFYEDAKTLSKKELIEKYNLTYEYIKNTDQIKEYIR